MHDIEVKTDSPYHALRRLAAPILELAAEGGFQCFAHDDLNDDGTLTIEFVDELVPMNLVGEFDRSSAVFSRFWENADGAKGVDELKIDAKTRIFAFVPREVTAPCVIVLAHPDCSVPVAFEVRKDDSES